MLENGQKEDRLLDYLYGELSDQEAREVEAHLAQDQAAAQELSRLREVRQTMAQLPLAMPRESVLEAIRKRAHQLAPQPPPKRNPLLAFLLRPSVAGAFVFVLVLAVGLYISRYSSDPEPKPDRASVGRFTGAPTPAPAAAVAAAPSKEPPALPETAAKTSAAKEEPKAGDGRRTDRVVARAEPLRKKLQRRRRAPRIIARVARPTPQSLFPKRITKRPPRQRFAGRSADPVRRDEGEDTGGRLGAIGLRGGANQELAKDALRSKGALSEVRLLARANRPSEPQPAPVLSQPSMAQGYLPRKQVERSAINREFVSGSRSATAANDQEIAQQAAPRPAPASPPPPPPPAEVSAYGGSAGKSAGLGDPFVSGKTDKTVQAKKPALAQTTTVDDAPRSLLERARQELAKGKVEAAIATLNKLLRAKGKWASREVYRLLAKAYERRGDAKLAARTRAREAYRFSSDKAANKAKRSRPAADTATKAR